MALKMLGLELESLEKVIISELGKVNEAVIPLQTKNNSSDRCLFSDIKRYFRRLGYKADIRGELVNMQQTDRHDNAITPSKINYYLVLSKRG